MNARLTLIALSLLIAPALTAAEATPEGRWKVIDDKDNQPVAIMKIFRHNGEYAGMIEDPLPKPAEDPNPRCKKCAGALKGRPLRGLIIMQGLKKDGDRYTGGTILDPDSGSVYGLKMTLGPDGNTLRVRGYLGFSLLGRTQTWYRADEPQASASLTAPPTPTTTVTTSR